MLKGRGSEDFKLQSKGQRREGRGPALQVIMKSEQSLSKHFDCLGMVMSGSFCLRHIFQCFDAGGQRSGPGSTVSSEGQG